EVVATPGEPYQGSVALDVTLEDIPRSISEISVVSPTGAEVVLWSGSAAPPRFETSRRIAGFDPSEVIAGVWTVQVRGATERASGLRLRAFDVR
ncbi:MAG: hypothetical protein KC417_00700, partial [Myxococcales bacterium]|nr:hypothetical protein [Myxococcales bacterium]